MKLSRVWVALFLVLGVLPCGPAVAEELNLYAAASLTEALKEISASYESRSGNKLVLNFAASSTLARQIQEGAPADLFFSADEAKMDALEKRRLLMPGTRRSLLSNTLVIVQRQDTQVLLAAPQDLAKDAIRRIALAEPQSVPAGIYAKEYLRQLHLWGKVIDKVVPTENVRAALAAVEAGNADAAIVYKTDAGIARQIRVAYEVPAGAGPRISYPLAVLKESRHPDAARDLLSYLLSEPSREVFRRYGFLITYPSLEPSSF